MPGNYLPRLCSLFPKRHDIFSVHSGCHCFNCSRNSAFRQASRSFQQQFLECCAWNINLLISTFPDHLFLLPSERNLSGFNIHESCKYFPERVTSRIRLYSSLPYSELRADSAVRLAVHRLWDILVTLLETWRSLLQQWTKHVLTGS